MLEESEPGALSETYWSRVFRLERETCARIVHRNGVSVAENCAQ